jgi:hypothetical protein
MKSFVKLLAAISLLGTLFLMSGCQLDADDPLSVAPPPTTVAPNPHVHIDQVNGLNATSILNTFGFIEAGETGSRVIVQDFGPNGMSVASAPGGTQTWECIVNAAANVRFRISATYSYAGTGNFLDASQSGSIRNTSDLQFASVIVYDSIWRCQTWAIDSSTSRIETYNTLSGGTCSGAQAQFMGTDARDKPMMYPVGYRIDGTLPWGQIGGGYFYYSSERDYPSTLPNGASASNSELRRYRFWTPGAQQYVAIRWWSHTRYRYGYVKVAASGNSVTVYAVGYEA